VDCWALNFRFLVIEYYWERRGASACISNVESSGWGAATTKSSAWLPRPAAYIWPAPDRRRCWRIPWRRLSGCGLHPWGRHSDCLHAHQKNHHRRYDQDLRRPSPGLVVWSPHR